MQPEVLAEERTHTMGCRGFPDEARSLLRSLGSSGAASRPPGEQSSSPSLLSHLGDTPACLEAAAESKTWGDGSVAMSRLEGG